MIAGISSEPRVDVSNNKLNFGQMSCNQTKQLDVQLINEENTPYNYKVSIPSEIQQDITIQPTQGIVPPKGKISLFVTCKPKMEQKTSQLVQIQVAKKSMPL